VKQIKLPVKLRNDMIDFISLTIPAINRLFADSYTGYISDGFTDTKIIKTFESLRYWLRIGELELEKKAYDHLADELADFMLLEELNKGVKRGKKNSSN
jgi:hypothetical protein